MEQKSGSWREAPENEMNLKQSMRYHKTAGSKYLVGSSAAPYCSPELSRVPPETHTHIQSGQIDLDLHPPTVPRERFLLSVAVEPEQKQCFSQLCSCNSLKPFLFFILHGLREQTCPRLGHKFKKIKLITCSL